MMYKKIIVLVLIASITGCSSTIINSSPGTARVYSEGEFLGKTPYKYKDAKVMFSHTKLTLKKKGYEDKTITLKRNEEMHWTSFGLGFIFLFPWIWSREYKGKRTIELDKKEK